MLVLDEPTTAVDPEGRQVIRDIIRAERDRGCALLITTHELDEAERLADRLVIMHRGHVVAQGTLDGARRGPRDDHRGLRARRPRGARGGPRLRGRADGPFALRCAVGSTPERIAAVTTT